MGTNMPIFSKAREAGFTIIEVLIAASLASGLAFFLGDMSLQMSKVAKTSAVRTDLDNLNNRLRILLKNQVNCSAHSGLINQTFTPSSPQSTQGFTVSAPSGGSLIIPGFDSASYRITNTYLKDAQPLAACVSGGSPCRYLASLAYDVEIPNAVGVSNLTFERPLEVVTTAADADSERTITGCEGSEASVAGPSEQEICESMNGVFYPNGVARFPINRPRHCSLPLTLSPLMVDDPGTCQSCWGSNNLVDSGASCTMGTHLVGLRQSVVSGMFRPELICEANDGTLSYPIISSGNVTTNSPWYRTTAWSLRCEAGQKVFSISQDLNTASERIRLGLGCRTIDSASWDNHTRVSNQVDYSPGCPECFGPASDWEKECPGSSSSSISGVRISRSGPSTLITFSCN